MKANLWILSAVLLLASRALPAEEYTLGPDSQRHDGVPIGTVTKRTWTSKIFPGTVRDYWIYVPAQYRAGPPLSWSFWQPVCEPPRATNEVHAKCQFPSPPTTDWKRRAGSYRDGIRETAPRPLLEFLSPSLAIGNHDAHLVALGPVRYLQCHHNFV
jgi:hypothetical protein